MKIYNVERKEAYDPDTEPSKIDNDDLQYLDEKDYEYIICSYAQDMWSGEGAASYLTVLSIANVVPNVNTFCKDL